MSKLQKIGIGLFSLFLIIQIFHSDLTNPEYDIKNDFIVVEKPPVIVIDILQNSCYDCHSNKTEYPWYANVAPFSWWIIGHINEAREELNFSEWATYSVKRKKHKLKETIEEVEEGEMPLESYTWMHDDAGLSDEQVKLLTDWVKTIQ